MAMAPQARHVAANAFVFRSNPSIVDFQDTPLSSDRHTPPAAVATYIGEPPGAIAIPGVRPLTAGRPTADPRACTEGPRGIQLLVPGMTGDPGAPPPRAPRPRRGEAAFRR